MREGWRGGGCHCGAVRFEVRIPDPPRAVVCNCSICTKKGYVHLLVDAGDLRVLSGADALSEYRFGTGVARHLFCRTCGVHPYYLPRSHPDGFSVNARCLDGEDPLDGLELAPFDGRHWEDGIDDLRAAHRPPR